MRLLAVAVSVIVTGCSDAKSPNAANFRKVIEPLVADAYCRTLNPTRMAVSGQPDTLTFPIYITAQGSPFDPGRTDRAFLEDLAKAGFLKRTEVTADARHGGGTEPMTRQALLRFEPTALGAGHLRSISAMTYGGQREMAAVCAAKGQLVDVVRWTEPADIMGQHVTQVTYTMKGTDPIAGSPPQALALLDKVQEKTIPLVLTSDGWRTTAR